MGDSKLGEGEEEEAAMAMAMMLYYPGDEVCGGVCGRVRQKKEENAQQCSDRQRWTDNAISKQ